MFTLPIDCKFHNILLHNSIDEYYLEIYQLRAFSVSIKLFNSSKGHSGFILLMKLENVALKYALMEYTSDIRLKNIFNYIIHRCFTHQLQIPTAPPSPCYVNHPPTLPCQRRQSLDAGYCEEPAQAVSTTPNPTSMYVFEIAVFLMTE